jgi:two-component system NarL family sensor kinase
VAKPSSKQVAPKLGYVVAVPAWNWMLGTGIYLDDVEQTLRQLDARAETDIRETMAWIGVIAAISILLVAASGLALNISEHREADAKLRQLAQRVVQSQEEERARLSRELHDGISQLLVSVKLVLEALPTASAWRRRRRVGGADPRHGAEPARFRFQRSAARGAQPAPALLDDLGLFAPAASGARDAGRQHAAGGVRQTGQPRAADEQATALFRIAQEALTNVERHAHATRVTSNSNFSIGTRLTVRDNGTGFDVAACSTTRSAASACATCASAWPRWAASSTSCRCRRARG